MYVNTVRDVTSTFAEFLAQGVKSSIDFCEEMGVTIPEPYRYAMDSDYETFKDPYTAKNFHHCVAVKMADDYWLMLDPYQNVLLPIAPVDTGNGNTIEETFQLLRSNITACPGLTISYNSNDYGAVHGPLNEYLQDCFQSIIDAQLYVENFSEPARRFFGGIHFALERGWFPSFWEETWEKIGISSYYLLYPRKKRGPNRRTFYECSYGWVGSTIIDTAAENQFSDLEKLVEYYDRDAGFAYRFRENFEISPILRLLKTLRDYAFEKKEGHNHFVVEFGNPLFQLACNTLNHLAAWDAEFAELIPPFEIAKFSGSQLVWHDAIARWYNAGEPEQDKPWHDYLVSQLERLRPYQWHFQTRQLLTHPDDHTKETSDGDTEECRTESSGDQEAA